MYFGHVSSILVGPCLVLIFFCFMCPFSSRTGHNDKVGTFSTASARSCRPCHIWQTQFLCSAKSGVSPHILPLIHANLTNLTILTYLCVSLCSRLLQSLEILKLLYCLYPVKKNHRVQKNANLFWLAWFLPTFYETWRN